MKKKIGISGVHGTGKSTMCFDIAKNAKIEHKNSRVIVVNENVIDCPLKINAVAGVMSQMWMMCDQIKREIELCEKFDIVVCDRTVFDPICYCYAIADISEPGDRRDQMMSAADSMFFFATSFGYTYDEIILIDGSNIDMTVDDGLRSTDPVFRKAVNERFLRIFSMLKKEDYIKNYTIIK